MAVNLKILVDLHARVSRIRGSLEDKVLVEAGKRSWR